MRIRHPLAQAAILVVAAIVIGIVTNGFASRTRRLVLPGYYPDARHAPSRTAKPVPPPPITDPDAITATATVETPAPVVPTATTATNVGRASARPPETKAATTTQEPSRAEARPTFLPHPDKAYVEIAGDDVAALYASGALFLDARRTSVYEEGHIAGARSFSVWEADIDDKVNALFTERSDPADQNKPIVIYCSGGACEDSHMLAQKLWGIQFNNVYVYKDGFPDWQKRGGAVHTGSNP